MRHNAAVLAGAMIEGGASGPGEFYRENGKASLNVQSKCMQQVHWKAYTPREIESQVYANMEVIIGHKSPQDMRKIWHISREVPTLFDM